VSQFYEGPLLCVRMRRQWIGSALIPLLQYFWFSMALVRSWIGFSAVDAHTLPDHFVQLTYSAGGCWARRSFLQLIWLACVWVVWNERNHRLFINAASHVPHLLDKIKLFSFRWLKMTNVTLASNSHSWWSNPLLCLGID
jgi:hypothetical protein